MLLESYIPTSVIPSSVVGMALRVPVLEFSQDEVEYFVREHEGLGAQLLNFLE